MELAVSVIVSTYNSVPSLEKTLVGLTCQTETDFQLVVADDGSDDATGDLIRHFVATSDLAVQHVWHEDQGFRKGRILNKAILAARGDYLVFLDGDCIPRNDFVAAHRRLARPNYYLSGGSHINIPAPVQSKISAGDIREQRVFDVRWLAAQEVDVSKSRFRLARNRWLASLLDTLTPRPGVFVGCNGSAWKRDLLAVNGFDETFSHGSDDKELGVRLTHHGVKSRRLKYSLICMHLDHGRGYSSEAQLRENKRRLLQLRRSRQVWTPHGIHSGPPSGLEAHAGHGPPHTTVTAGF